MTHARNINTTALGRWRKTGLNTANIKGVERDPWWSETLRKTGKCGIKGGEKTCVLVKTDGLVLAAALPYIGIPAGGFGQDLIGETFCRKKFVHYWIEQLLPPRHAVRARNVTALIPSSQGTTQTQAQTSGIWPSKRAF